MNSEPDSGQDMVSKAMPKDAQVMVSILRDMGIMEWEPRVINQLLEFSYGYVTTVLDDAKTLSTHAKKKTVDVDDVRLAVQMYTDSNATTPPPRDVLLEVARVKNNSTLPIPKPSSGLRLPPDRFCLTSCNFKLRSSKRQPPPRPGPYYYGSTPMATSAAVSLRPKMPYTIVNNPSTPMHSMSRPILKTTPNKIQLQPASTGGPTVYTMTINPNSKWNCIVPENLIWIFIAF